MFKQADLAGSVSAENKRLLQDLAGSADRLQEVHHRIRNHLQAVSGLLSAQELTEASPTARRALRKSVGRLASIATIHDLLARDPVSGVLRLPELSQQLAQHLITSMNAEGRVSVKTEVAPIVLGTRQATALVLILVELISNAIEHGFPDMASGQIAIEVASAGDAALLEVRDTGRGLPPDFDLRRANSLGLGLVTRLAERDLDGAIAMEDDGGAVFRITFPLQGAGGAE